MASLNKKDQEILVLLEDIARQMHTDDPVHDYHHVKRVRQLARRIADELGEPVDDFVLEAAVLLHDIARGGNNEDHALASAELAEKLLLLLGVDKDRIEKIVDAIASHSFSSKRQPRFIEGKILSDADKLDALGAIGIARVFMYGGRERRELQKSIQHFKEKILILKNRLYTAPAKALANERHEFVEEYLKRLENELQGKS